MTISFRPKGVCSQKMEIQVEDDKIVSLKILGGCHGNLQGISALVKGMDVDEVIAKLGGIRCGMKPTSCPDQLAKALREHREAEKSDE
ncbi:MAG: TIGR03905 family TSCPD domain-containing protein [Oscillospiraceae bacterium]